jgi:hypothetical protein
LKKMARVLKLSCAFFLPNAGHALAESVAPFSADTSLAYDLLTLGHGNNNSVKPGDPSGFRLSESFTYRYGAFRNLRLFVESGLHLASWSASRSEGNTKVDTRLNTIGLDFGTGACALFNDRWTGEVSLGGSYSPYSQLSYKAVVQGYEPIESNATLGNLYQIAFSAKALWTLKKGLQLGGRLSSFTGGYGWYNPGTQVDQKDTFSSFGLAFVFRYWVGNETAAAFDWSRPEKPKYPVKQKPQSSKVLKVTTPDSKTNPAKEPPMRSKKLKNFK